MQAHSKFIHEKYLRLTVSNVMMRYSSQIKAVTINLEIGDVHVEGEATIDCSGRNLEASGGLGRGEVTSVGHGVGGGHGGYGGGADIVNYGSGIPTSQI